MNVSTVPLKIPEGCNIILGQTHFIKTVEDLYEIMTAQVPAAKFGLAFCEASGPCLVRWSGTDGQLTDLAKTTAHAIGAGHSFVIFLRDCFPINVLPVIRQVPEVCHIYCATANAVDVILAETDQGRGILGVIDGSSPKGIEQDLDIQTRKTMLRQFGYKL